MTIKSFQKKILDWYKENKREMPWRDTRDPYKILVSEIMLQQTQISRVLPKYEEFLKAFPSLEALAKAPDKKLLKVWSGLGYWRRAKFLKETANILTKKYGGKFPKNPGELEKFPGIGPYTARAVACFAFGRREAFLDTNIRRVYLHYFFEDRENVSDKEILTIAQKAVDTPSKGITPRQWHYALFDYGATVLKDKTVNRRSRHYAKQSIFEGSFRSFRTQVIHYLLKQPNGKVSKKKLVQFLDVLLKKQRATHPSQKIIDALLKDKIIKQGKTHFFL